MNDLRRPQTSSDRTMLTEVSVAGSLGPVLSAAFTDLHITTQRACTVIRTGPMTDRDLTDLVRTLVERGLVIQSAHRLSDRPRRPSPWRSDIPGW